MQKNHTSALGSLQLVEKEDLDTSDHATMAACEERVDQTYSACIGCNRGTVERLTAKARERKASGANGFGTGFEDGWGIYRRKWGQGCSRKRELPKPRNEGKKSLRGAV